jgi:hypothetical protein
MSRIQHETATGSRAASPLLRQINDGNWLPQREAEALRAELFYQRAVHAYVTMLPALNVIGMRDGSEAQFGRGFHACRSGRTGWTAARGFRRPTRTSSTR